MKRNNFVLHLLLYICFFVHLPQLSHGYTLRQYSGKNGLSNSAILSIYQDKDGFMWFGSCDGLNRFDGVGIRVYKPSNDPDNLSGNLIESIAEDEEGMLWIQTNYGLDRFDRINHRIHTFREFNRKGFLSTGKGNRVYIIKEDNYIHYYDPAKELFHQRYIHNLLFDDILDMIVDDENVLWVFTQKNGCQRFNIEISSGDVNIIPVEPFSHPEKLLSVFHEKEQVYFVDQKYHFYEMDIRTGNKQFLYDLTQEITRKGEIASIVRYYNDYYIGFKSSGLLRLKEGIQRKVSYEIHEIEIKSGIFCLVKDKFQDVLWVGTDGQGVYMYYIDSFSVSSTTFSNLTHDINNPVRAILHDQENTLWIGTKGDGILKVTDYEYNTALNKKHTELLTTQNSGLNDNSVYVFAESNRPVYWIGTEDGLQYYSYKERQIRDVAIPDEDQPVRYVHAIIEQHDSILWIATVGEGIVKAILDKNREHPVIRSTKRFLHSDGLTSSNYFFTSYQENDSTIWFGNRGFGAFCFDTRTETYQIVSFDREDRNQTLNDVFSITKNNKGYWFGTSYGLIRMQDGLIDNFNESMGFPNNTVHAILKDRHENLWMSTNQGIVKFNTLQMTFQTFKPANDQAVTEFSDGAYFKDDQTGTMLFGGINGFVAIQENDYAQQAYFPGILFDQLSVFGRDQNINDFMRHGSGADLFLELDYSQNFFTISFTAIDYIRGDDYTWFYKLDELSDNWIENGKSNSAAFTNILPGNYTLSVKYRNNILDEESSPHSLKIRILPPWYQTTLAYLLYGIAGVLLLFFAIRLTMKWYEMKKTAILEKLTRYQKEEVYESKLRFFTNITHELCTPLTLIYGPCERILAYGKSDEYVRKYAGLIRQNTEKLNSLILELIEFRRLETGNRQPELSECAVSELTRNVADSFLELAESKGFHYDVHIPATINWVTDRGCVTKILTNLISNAFKYTDDQGKISVAVYVENDTLNISVSNTGKGIRPEQIPEIFDRYKILDTFEVQSRKGSSTRNGLGLAICHSMVKLLEGDIRVDSTPGEVTTFHVCLPLLESNTERVNFVELPAVEVNEEPSLLLKEPLQEFDKSKPTLMIVEDDPSMLWFVSEIFIGKYNVLPVNNSKDVLEKIVYHQPDLIISDIMMPDVDGITLTKAVKADKRLRHIPIILLSARIDSDHQVEGIEAGAEAYVTKPFNVHYLEKIVNRFIQQKGEMKEYYGSAISSFEMNNGQLMHKDDKALFERIINIIDHNINNPDLNVEMISAELGISSRQLYRRIKNMTEQTPNDLIKDFKLNLAERLLKTTNLSIKEIIFQTGFGNKGNFYRIFSARYGMTPRSYREQNKREATE